MPKPDSQLPPIPLELHSEYEERPFRSCTRCGEGLHDFREGYKVSKVVKNGETIFEYALCYHCVVGMMNESSAESRQALNAFHQERVRAVEGTHDCSLCERTRDDLEPREYALVAGCLGLGLVEAHMVCGHCMEEMSALVSQETRDQWNRFVEENFPGVPADFIPNPQGPVKLPV